MDQEYYTTQFIRALATIQKELKYCEVMLPEVDALGVMPEVVRTNRLVCDLLAHVARQKCENDRPEWCKDPDHPTHKCRDCPNFSVHFSDAGEYCKLSLRGVQ